MIVDLENDRAFPQDSSSTPRNARRLLEQIEVNDGKLQGGTTLAIRPISSCALCHDPNCFVRYNGTEQVQQASVQALFGFPWRKNSCPLDTIASGLFFIWSMNFNDVALQTFELHFGELNSIFRGMMTTETNTFQAKILLEELFAKNCEASGVPYLTAIELHSFGDVPSAFNMLFDTTNRSTPIFLNSVTSTKTCDLCSASYDAERLNFNVFDLDIFSLPNDSQKLEIGFTGSCACSREPFQCRLCNDILVRYHSNYSGPMILYVSPFQTPEVHNPNETAPNSIDIHSSTYHLSCVIYCTSGHFIVMARHAGTNIIYFCDGMHDSAKFISTLYINFPHTFQRDTRTFVFNSALYVRDESLRTNWRVKVDHASHGLSEELFPSTSDGKKIDSSDSSDSELPHAL